VWRRTASGPITTLKLKLETENLNALMAQFGYDDYIKRGTGDLDGTLVFRRGRITGTIGGKPVETSIPWFLNSVVA